MTMNSGQIASRIEVALAGEAQGKITVRSRTEPLFFPIDSPLVSRLLQAYQEVTGDLESKPITMAAAPMRREFITASPSAVNSWAKTAIFTTPTSLCGLIVCFSRQEIYVHALMKLLEA